MCVISDFVKSCSHVLPAAAAAVEETVQSTESINIDQYIEERIKPEVEQTEKKSKKSKSDKQQQQPGDEVTESGTEPSLKRAQPPPKPSVHGELTERKRKRLEWYKARLGE